MQTTPPDGVAAVGKPEADGKVQCIAVDPAQQSPNRRFRWQGPLGGQRVEPRADMFQHVGRSIGDPLADRQARLRPGQHRAGRQGQHHYQWVANPAGIAWIGHLGETLHQTGHLFRSDFGMLAELVKGRRDRL